MFTLPPLPYAYDALEPVIGAATMHLHHDKHHATYVEKANTLAAKAGLEDRSLEDVVREAAERGDQGLFNNAAQSWNHAFFWQSMSPDSDAPGADLADAIKTAFGDLAALKAAFVKEGAEHFASGWVWLVAKGGALEVISTHDADDTLPKPGLTPVLVCDLWEHAYYLDHKNDRKAFLEAWFDALPAWGFADAQWQAAKGGGGGFTYPG